MTEVLKVPKKRPIKPRSMRIDLDNVMAINELKKKSSWSKQDIYNNALRAGLEVLRNAMEK